MRKTHLPGRDRVGWAFTFAAEAYNLVRLPKLLDGVARAEFSWDGHNETDQASGRGWAFIGTAGRIVGHIFIHNSHGSGVVALRE